MKQFFSIILFLLIPTLSIANYNSNFSLTKITPEGGVSYTSVMCIEEDEMGFIWFGTNNGLYSYNSVEIRRYNQMQNDSAAIPTNRINKLYKDYTGKLWIATENGLCSYNRKTDNFKKYDLKDKFGNYSGKNVHSFFQTNDSIYWFADELGFGTANFLTRSVLYKNIENKNAGVRILSRDETGTVWVFLSDGEIYYLTKGSENFRYLTSDSGYSIRSVFIDRENIWIAYESNGLLCLRIDGSFKYNFSPETGLPSNQVRDILKTDNGQIWVGTYNGVAIIENYKITAVINEDKYSELPNHSVWSLFKDSQQNIWIGTWLGGLCFHSEYNNSFLPYRQSVPNSSLSYNVVSSFVQVPGKPELIVGTEDGKLNYFNPESNVFNNIPVSTGTIKSGNIKSLCYGFDETLYIGTYGDGVFYQKKNEKEFHKLNPPFNIGIQALDFCNTQDGLWVSNYPYGIYFYHYKSKEFYRYSHNPLNINSISDDNVHKIIQDKRGNMWFATRNGLNLLEKGSDRFIHFFHVDNNNNSISSNIIYTICEDEEGYLWLGTNGQGMDKFDPETHMAEHFTMQNGLPGNEIFSIMQDQHKKLWIATNEGICMFNPQTNEIRAFTSAIGIQNNRFNPNSSMVAANGELYFGGTNGFIRFFPHEIKINPILPSTIITHFYIHNKEILPGYDNEILKDVVAKTKSLTLNYKQNSISFRFVANNFIQPKDNRFKYRLVDFNDEWTETDVNGRATFTNLPSGTYIFEVKAANNDGIWNENPTKIEIHIIPPIWERWYAWLVYTILVALTIFYFRQQVINKQKLKNQIELEKVTRENEEYLHQMKLQFFTNISHEFRTPLTLIRGPVDRLIAESDGNKGSLKKLTLIKNNTERLLRLINQFLDFRKIDSGKIKLNLVSTDIVAFCKSIFNCFEDYARSRSFEFVFISENPVLKMDFDPDKIDKVLFNILSNAFKYSADGGIITLEVTSNKKTIINPAYYTHVLGEEITGDFIEISISDSGHGISVNHINKIFDRFYQTDNNSQIGTGIGLSLTKSYVLLHGGQLIVQTQENKGSVFTVRIPQFQEDNLMKEEIYESPFSKSEISKSLTDYSLIENQNKDALILIVEDNIELLDYIGELLQKYFKVAKTINGREALEQIHSIFPDLVISDIMMPEMNGIELCNTIKNDIRTSHIPIILLTALDTVKDRISGFHSGADAYISKPFDDQLIIARINNLLESRKRVRESFTNDNSFWEEKLDHPDLDKQFVLKAIQTVESNIDNYSLTVEMMAEELNMSRTHLHRKLKSITNQSATEFIRYIRLKNAVILMKKGDHKVNEIGYAVGFNSHNYFTKSFKKQFGKSPSEFMRNNLGKS